MTKAAFPPADCSIRPARVEDLPACAAVVNAFIDATPWLPRTLSHEEIAGHFPPDVLERRKILVADTGGTISGYMSLNIPENFLAALYLGPEVRGQGIGRAMLARAREMMPAGFTLTVWEPNRDAIRFYRREGLVEDPQGRVTGTDDGVPTLLYRWSPA